jgi:hypothetical protein
MSSQAFCGVHGCRSAARYQFSAGSAASDLRCSRHAIVYGPVLGRAGRVALLVGTILFVINQSDVVLMGQLTPLVVAKIALTYLVPFSVSTYSALAANRI